MAAVTICSDFGAPKTKSDTVPTVFPSISYEVMGPDAMILVFWTLSFEPPFSLCSFTFIKRLFSSSSLSDIEWCHLHIWGYWYFSWQSWFQLVLHPVWHFAWNDRLRGCNRKLMFVDGSLLCSHKWVKSSKTGIPSFRQCSVGTITAEQAVICAWGSPCSPPSWPSERGGFLNEGWKGTGHSGYRPTVF